MRISFLLGIFCLAHPRKLVPQQYFHSNQLNMVFKSIGNLLDEVYFKTNLLIWLSFQTMCWERCPVLCTLKNPAVVLCRSRNLCAPPQEAKLPTHLKFVDPIILVSHFIFHFIIIHVHFMFIAQIQLKYCCLGSNSQSINLSGQDLLCYTIVNQLFPQ